MKLKGPIYLAIGLGLLFLGHQIGVRADTAGPVGAGPDRATYHLVAALVTFGSICFFIAAIVSMLRSRRP